MMRPDSHPKDKGTMQPVLVLQFMQDDGPGYFGTWAAREGVRLDVRSAAAGHAFPGHVSDHAALVVLGGAMSANDDLPYLRDAEGLILRAMHDNVPVLGHCLGGQLMARTLGAVVGPSLAPEIGWHRMDVSDTPEAQRWFGSAATQQVFHWHYEAFDLPAGATCLGSSAACTNQAFAVGPHLALQFHVEIDARKIADWLQHGSQQYSEAQAQYASAQSPARILEMSSLWLASQQALADRIYRRWWAHAISR